MHKQVSFDIVNILGGDSIFMLQSRKTGVCYSYMVQKVKVEKSKSPASMFVNTYNVKISTDGEKYYYAGCLRHDTCTDIFKFITNHDSFYSKDSKCVQALLWALKNVGTGSILFYNLGRCSVCYGLLKDTKDIDKGYHNNCYIRGEEITRGENHKFNRGNLKVKGDVQNV